jgi:hypothetical protein
MTQPEYIDVDLSGTLLGDALKDLKLKKDGYCIGLGHSRKYTTCGKKLNHDPELKAKGYWQSPYCDDCSDEIDRLNDEDDDED